MKDLVGQRFGRLLVVNRAEKPMHLRNKNKSYWRCRCDCGTEIIVYQFSLKSGDTKSCGCLRREITIARHFKHGQGRSNHGRTAAYRAWISMRRRCLNPQRDNYQFYGGRGIFICEGWKENFQAFFDSMGEPPTNTTLDRMENNAGYYCGECSQCISNQWKKNCRWATKIEQARNTRKNRYITINGETLSLAEWVERLGIPYYLAMNRLRYGWSEKDALFISSKPGVPYRKRGATCA